MKPLALMLSVLVFTLGVTGCTTLDELGELAGTVGQEAGWMSEEEASSLIRSTAAMGKAFEQLTSEQEYYIGRSVAASILETYPVYNNPAATQYLNLIGQSLALASSRPETYGGYHFLILDQDEVNAFAAPGGLIFVTRGMVRLCPGEDELAAVLAHEIGHVAGRHGLRSIGTARINSALTILAAESARQFGDDDLKELTDAFEGSIGDITDTLVNSGYARGLEKQADLEAITTLESTGYDPSALLRVLKNMDQEVKPGGVGFGKTHPPASSRAAQIQAGLAGKSGSPANATRTQRFADALAGI